MNDVQDTRPPALVFSFSACHTLCNENLTIASRPFRRIGCAWARSFSILFRGGKSLEATWILTGIAGAVTFALWVRIHKGEMKSRMLPDALWMPAILFVVWTFVSFAFSTTKNYGLDEVLRDSSLVLLFLWILRMGGSQSEDRFSFLHKLIFALLIATVLSCFVGITVYVFQPVNRFVGTFFDPRFHTDYWPNAWAEYLLLVWPLFLWFRSA